MQRDDSVIFSLTTCRSQASTYPGTEIAVCFGLNAKTAISDECLSLKIKAHTLTHMHTYTDRPGGRWRL